MDDADGDDPTFPVPSRSTAALIIGVALLVVSFAGLLIAASMTLDSALNGPRWDADLLAPTTVFSVLLGIGGLVSVCVGIHRLTSTIDYLARRDYAREHTDS